MIFRASIMGYTEYIKSVANKKELKNMADVVLKNAERVKNTVKRLLYIAKKLRWFTRRD